MLDIMDVTPDELIAADAGDQARVTELEARIKWLEGALTSVLQARRSTAVSGEASLFAVADKPQAVPADTSDGTRCLSPISFAADRAAPHAARGDDAGRMRFTSAFATLDQRVIEQAELESLPQRRADLTPPVAIDAGLIDLAFARPAPELIEVRSYLEEGYPHLLERITATWRTPELVRYLAKLIVDERGGRQGFPFEVMSELLVLSSLLETPESRDEWGSAQVR